MRHLKFALFAAVSTIAFAQIASAADMPTKGPAVVPPPPPPSWTGFYAGIHAGVGWADEGDASASIFREGPGASTGFGEGELDRSGSNAFLFGGGYLGYNFQINTFVLGLEADISGATGRRDGFLHIEAGSHKFDIDAELGMDWFGTVRARAGFLVNPAWLLYATGGLAYGNVANDVTGTLYKGSLDACGAAQVVNCPTIFSSNDSGIKTGWTIGAGTEFALDGRWHAKFEYLYVDLGESSGSFPVTTTQLRDGNAAQDEFATTSAIWNQKNQFHTFKVGLSYKFF